MSEKEKEEIVVTKAIPKAKVDVGIDVEASLYSNIVGAAAASTLDIGVLESFLNVSQNREQTYKLIDSMAQDSTISAILETYAEDAVEANDDGAIVWAESSDAGVNKYVNFLLDSINVNKHIYSWAYSLIKYGDLYLRLYRESDYENDSLFGGEKEKKPLNEAVILHANPKSDHYVHYLERVANPAEMFELVKFGKSMGYIKAPSRILSNTGVDNFGLKNNTLTNLYRMKKNDVHVYQATDFIHAALEDNSSRTPEEVQIFTGDDTDETSQNYTYTVRRGQSILYNSFRIWRELMLLKNSVLLNRVTKSSIIRLIQVEVGAMGKEEVGPYLQQIKQLVEQKSAINTNQSMQEYTNPGPIENNIYLATHDGKGAITTAQIGGDVDVKSLADISLFEDDLYGSLRAPKQFFGKTDDAAGFSGGESLALISSRYGKSIKRIQSTLIQGLTDAINLILLDKGLASYVNKFVLKMQGPVTKEEVARRENDATKIRIVGDIMSQLSDIQTPVIKLKMLKNLISTAVSDSEMIELIQEEIDKLEAEEEEKKQAEKSVAEEQAPEETDFESEMIGSNGPQHIDQEFDVFDDLDQEEPLESDLIPADNETDDYLETPADLGVDLTQNV